MTKHANPALNQFGVRLRTFRNAEGLTQQQLAEEIGVSRRKIAYYETESAHPPASLLVDLARALNTNVDALLGLESKSAKAPKVNRRLERRLRQIETLRPKARNQILQFIDTYIEAEQLKQQAGS